MQFVTLKNKNIEVILSSRGASIYRIIFDNKDMIVSPKDEKDFLRKDIYFGKTIGMVCGRITKDGQIILHGGPEGLSNQDFDYVVKDNVVEFSYKKVKVIYTLIGSELTMKYQVEVDEPQLVALTNHSYFCLGDQNLDDLKLRMNSDRLIEYDDKLTPIGIGHIKNKYDFKDLLPVLSDGTIDNFFYVDDGLVELRNNQYDLVVESDFEGSVLFTDHFSDGVITQLTDKDTFRGLAIEPQDSQLNRKELLPGQVYTRYIKYRFTKL